LKILVLASAGGEEHRRTLTALVANAAREHDVRVLAPDAEGKLLRPLGVPVESWQPSGLFSDLGSVGVLRRAVERDDPEVLHAVGWTAAAVALGSLAPARAARTVVTLPEPVRDHELPRAFAEKRLPELLRRAARVTVANAGLAGTLAAEFGLASERVDVVPLAAPAELSALYQATARSHGDAGPRGSQTITRNPG
jgi:hypothetical protein